MINPPARQYARRTPSIFGKRDDLLIEAKTRIKNHPGKYHEDRVYGETEGGGTQVLYLSHVAFENIGLAQARIRVRSPQILEVAEARV